MSFIYTRKTGIKIILVSVNNIKVLNVIPLLHVTFTNIHNKYNCKLGSEFSTHRDATTITVYLCSKLIDFKYEFVRTFFVV